MRRSGLILLVMAVVLVVLFWGSNILYPLDKTESLQLDIARTMHAEHSLVVPRVSGGPYFDKPPLPYWVAWPVFQFFPAEPWLARLGAAVASSLGVLATVLLVRHQGGCDTESPRRSLRRALLAGLILACLPGYAAFAHVAVHDSYITTCITVAAAGLYVLLFGQPHPALGPRRLAVIVGLAMGLGFLAKGLLAWGLPVAVVLAFTALTRQGGLLLRRLPQLLLSAALAVALPLPWLLAALHEAGPAFIAGFLGRSNLARVTSTVDGHRGPWFYYLPVVLLLSFPWGLLAIPNRARWRQLAGQARRRHPSERSADLQLFALVWLVLTVLLLSVASTKLPHYILSCLPPLAILAAFNLVPEPPTGTARQESYSRSSRFYGLLGAGTAGVLAAGGLVFAPVAARLIKPDRVFPDYTAALVAHLEGAPLRGLLVLMAAAVVGVLIWIPQRRTALVTAWTLVAVLNFSTLVPGVASVYRQHRQAAILELADAVAQHTTPGVPIVILGKSYHSVALRSGHPILRLDGWPEVVALQRSTHGHAFDRGLVVVAPRHRMLTEPQVREAGLRVAGVDQRQNLLAVRLRSAGPARS
ncbi:glycosyltransferase family 39 protein [Cyanobium sp. NIES-981]|uniref:ArnT family glycosyltransferase n=1 Tax=Cyanobium sp. NIES-981 TaxID=1851505 RepID=UPI0007DE167A|nr:phospholipid carrier-dependent glycosyltransferase [Cyanobium sp. NIES-981]SBO42773.1 Glycosyl transferase, family 39 [Cyanobium sp. NIES-981]